MGERGEFLLGVTSGLTGATGEDCGSGMKGRSAGMGGSMDIVFLGEEEEAGDLPGLLFLTLARALTDCLKGRKWKIIEQMHGHYYQTPPGDGGEETIGGTLPGYHWGDTTWLMN